MCCSPDTSLPYKFKIVSVASKAHLLIEQVRHNQGSDHTRNILTEQSFTPSDFIIMRSRRQYVLVVIILIFFFHSYLFYFCPFVYDEPSLAQ